VSVVIPCYEQARFLPTAIESVLAQTYEPIEIVVVDDGSSDNTSSVAARYPGVRTIRTANQGLPAARNTGLAATSGRLCVFLDADDRLRSDAIAQGVACFADHPECGLVYGRHVRFWSDGTAVSEGEQPRLSGDPFEALLRGNIIGCVDAVLWRRDAVLAAGAFDRGLPAVEDWDMYLRMAQRFPIAQHDGVVAEVLLHDKSMHRDFALILKFAMSVLRRQRAVAMRSQASRGAYREGVRWLQLTYGVRLARQIPARLRSRTARAKAVRDLAVLLRFYPGVVLHTVRRAPALLRGRKVSERAVSPGSW
jgi:glycosyltransferase involved in cell wall biosynthesis